MLVALAATAPAVLIAQAMPEEKRPVVSEIRYHFDGGRKIDTGSVAGEIDFVYRFPKDLKFGQTVNVSLRVADTSVPPNSQIGNHCSSVVTFSGQEIEMAGKKITVLAAAGGGIILTSDEFAWSSSAPDRAMSGLAIKARAL